MRGSLANWIVSSSSGRVFLVPMIINRRKKHRADGTPREKYWPTQRPVPTQASKRGEAATRHPCGVDREGSAMPGAQLVQPLIVMDAMGPPEPFAPPRATGKRDGCVRDEGQKHEGGKPRRPAARSRHGNAES